MSTYAQEILTGLGFKRMRYEDYLSKLQADAKEIFGENVDLDDESPLGQWIKLQAFQRAEENELAERVFLWGSVDYAEGVALDYAVGKYGVQRFQASKSKGTDALSLTVTAGSTVEAGFIGATESGIQFRTTETVTDDDNNGTVVADIESIEYGPFGNQAIGTITEIVTPLANVTAITNTVATAGGRNREEDKELRARYYKTIATAGGSTTDSVLSELLELPDVRAAIVTENDSDTTDGNGNPPHSISPVVLGGTPESIAYAIHRKKAGGIRSYGTQTFDVTDKSGRTKTIGFSYAATAEIYVNVNLSKNSAFPENGDEEVQRQIIEYIGGEDADGNTYLGLGMAASVIHSQLLRAVTVPGISDMTVTLRKGASGGYAAANITIGSTEVAETDAGKVVVTVA